MAKNYTKQHTNRAAELMSQLPKPQSVDMSIFNKQMSKMRSIRNEGISDEAQSILNNLRNESNRAEQERHQSVMKSIEKIMQQKAETEAKIAEYSMYADNSEPERTAVANGADVENSDSKTALPDYARPIDENNIDTEALNTMKQRLRIALSREQRKPSEQQNAERISQIKDNISQIDNSEFDIPVNNDRNISVKYKTAEALDKYIRNNPKQSNGKKAQGIDNVVNSLGLKDKELEDAKSYAGLKKLSLLDSKPKENLSFWEKAERKATYLPSKFVSGMWGAAKSAHDFLANGGLDGDYSDEYRSTQKYYEENPDKLGNALFADRQYYGNVTNDYLRDVTTGKFADRYNNISKPGQLIGSGVESAGKMYGSAVMAAMTGIPQAMNYLGFSLGGAKAALNLTKAGKAAGKVLNATPQIASVAKDGTAASLLNKAIGGINKVSAGSAVKFLNPFDNPTTTMMGISSAQDKYNELLKMGYSKETAKNNALFTGYVNTITEKMGYDGTDESMFIAGNKILTGNTSASKVRNTKNILKKYLSSNVSEGMEEVYATVFERMGDYISKVGYVDDDGSVKQRKIFGNEGIFDFSASRDSFLGGFVGGAVMGAAGVVSNIANTDVKDIRAHADVISKQTARMTEQMNNISEKAGVDDISMPKPPTWSEATIDEINSYYTQTIDTFGKLLTDERVINNDNKAIENATKKITDKYLHRFSENVSQGEKIEPKRAMNGLTNLSKNISSNFNSVTSSTPYADIFDTNVKFLSSPNNVIDRDHVSDYAKVFVDAIADSNLIAYNEISKGIDDIPSALTDSVINNTVPEKMKGNGIYAQTVDTFEKLLKNSLHSEYSIRNRIYDSNSELDAQMSEIINNNDFTVINAVSPNNNENIQSEEYYEAQESGRNETQTAQEGTFSKNEYAAAPNNNTEQETQGNSKNTVSDTLGFRKVGNSYEIYGNEAVKFAKDNGLEVTSKAFPGGELPTVSVTDTVLKQIADKNGYNISSGEYNGDTYITLNNANVEQADTNPSKPMQITESEQRAIESLSKACNVRVEIVPTIQGGIANGIYKNGTIYIAEDAENKPLAVLSHEITHHFEAAAPEAYELYKKAVSDIYTLNNEQDINVVAEKIAKKYGELGIELSKDEAIQEIVADYTKNLFTDEAAINDFISKAEQLNVSERKSVLQNLHEAIVAVIDKIKSFFGKGYKSTDIDRMQKAADALSAMIAETERNSGGGNFEMANIQTAEAADIKQSLPEAENLTAKDSQILNDYSRAVNDIITADDKTALTNAENRVAVKIMDNTPDVILKNIKESKDLPIMINYTKLYLAARENGVIKGNYHSLGADIVSKLPDMLTSPDAIIQLANGRLNLLSQVTSNKGNNALVSVELNSNKDIEGKNKNYNVVVTLFASDDNYIKNIASKEGVSLRYEKKDLSQVNPQLYNYLATINDKSSVDNSLSQNKSIVNNNSMQKSEDNAKSANNSPEAFYEVVEKGKNAAVLVKSKFSERRGAVEQLNKTGCTIKFDDGTKSHIQFSDIENGDFILTENGFKTKLGMEYTFESTDKKYSMKENASNAAGNIYDYTKSFDEQLNDWLQGKIPQRDSLMIGATPDVFKKVGFNALPVTINQKHIDYALNGTKDANHALGIDMLKQLPKALEKPVAIFASQTQPNRVVAIVDMKHNGKSVVMPIEVDGYSRQNNIRIDSNAIVSVYAKDNAVTKQLNDAIQNEMKGNTSVFYLNKIKAAALLRRAGLQLPRGPFLNSGYIHSIRENGSNVKPKFENVIYSQQFKKWFGDWEKKPNTASKVVNEDGTPKVVYHGTRANFNTFVLKSEAEFGRALGDGFYFTEDYKRAFRYANGITGKDHGGHVMSVYLDIKRPFYITEQNKMNYGAELEDGLFEGKYDGVIDTRNGTYLVFSSNQIKSATDNVGTFDGSNADIRYSLKENDLSVNTKDITVDFDNLNKARKEFVEFARENFPQSVVNKNTKKEIGISRTGIDKFLSGNITKEKYATGFKIPQLIESAVKVGEAENKKGKQGINGYEYYYNTIAVDGNEYAAHIRVRNTDMGDKYYGHTISKNVVDIEIEPLAWNSDNKSVHPINAAGSSMNNISHNSDNVNTYNMQNGGKNSIKSGVDGKTLTDLINEYGSIEKGEKAAREIKFPKKTAENKYVSKFVRTLAEAGATPDYAAGEFEKIILDGKVSHIPITNKGAMQYAVHTINKEGFRGALNMWNTLIKSEHRLTKNDIALGQQLYNQCINNKDTENAIKISVDLCAESTRSAQNTQASRMLKMLGADGQLYYMERTVQNINNELDKKGVKTSSNSKSFFNQINRMSKLQGDKAKNSINGTQRNLLIHMFNNNNISAARKALLGLNSKNFSADDVGFIDFLARNYKKEIIKYDKINNNDFEKVTLNPILAKKFLEAKNQEARDNAYDEICQDIADQIPVTKLEKWNAWRYLSMLGNPRTHIRNITGNAVFYPVVRMKSYLAAVMEHAVLPADQRTTSLTKTKESKTYAAKDFEIIKKELQGVNAKYAITDDIQSKRTVFKSKLLEFLRKWNGDMLELEDMFFLKRYYIDAFARFMTARKLTAKDFDISTEKGMRNLEAARAAAFREAQEATYRDDNTVADLLSKGQHNMQNSDSKVLRGLGYGVEAVMPFKKTPLNIGKRGVEYSPVGLMNGIYDTLYSVKKGNVTAAEAINKIAKGMTGTALTILGFALAHKGIATGAGEEDEKKSRFDALIGKQIYSISIGGKSYTVDWAAPNSLPFFVGVELYNAIQGKGWNFAKCVNALGKITEPMLELSCLQGISNAVESVQYNGTNTAQALAEELTTSYISQALPTLGGQIARITDGTKRNAYYTYKDSSLPTSMQKFIGSAMAKTPLVSKLLEPKIDSWGREVGYGQLPERVTENLVSPGYYSKEEYTAVDKELERLYRSTGETDALPGKVSKKFSYEKEEYNMNVHEYTDFSRLKGQKSFELINDLINGKSTVQMRKNNHKVSLSYSDMTDAEKLKAVSGMYTIAGDYAKEETVKKYYPKKYKEAAAKKNNK